MAGTIRSLLLILAAPPVWLLLWAHLVRPHFSDSDILALAVAGLLGLAGVATAPWRDGVRLVVAIVYVLLAFVALPFIGLLAVCTTGDCL